MTDYLWYAPRNPSDIVPRPWLHDEVVDYFESILKPSYTLIEHGAGGSTLWFAERVERVITIEHVSKWANAVESLAPENVTVLHHSGPIPADLPVADVLYIDGARVERTAYVANAARLVRPGGWVVLDNSNRPEYVQERLSLIELCGPAIKAFDKNESFSLYFKTEFYQLPAPTRRKRKASNEIP